jgi:hypothetical protein
MTGRELLELAAKAAGLEIHKQIQAKRDSSIDPEAAGLFIVNGSTWWNPITDDGDALRLAVNCMASVEISEYEASTYVYAGPFNAIISDRKSAMELWGDDRAAATRRAIVRAVAEIGKGMK